MHARLQPDTYSLVGYLRLALIGSAALVFTWDGAALLLRPDLGALALHLLMVPAVAALLHFHLRATQSFIPEQAALPTLAEAQLIGCLTFAVGLAAGHALPGFFVAEAAALGYGALRLQRRGLHPSAVFYMAAIALVPLILFFGGLFILIGLNGGIMG